MTQSWNGQDYDEQPEAHHAEMCRRDREGGSFFGEDGYIKAREEVATEAQREPTEAEVLARMVQRAEDYFCGAEYAGAPLSLRHRRIGDLCI